MAEAIGSEQATKKKPEPKSQLRGTITIKVYLGQVPEIKFDGHLTGRDVTIAWRRMMKAYRQWKAKLLQSGIMMVDCGTCRQSLNRKTAVEVEDVWYCPKCSSKLPKLRKVTGKEKKEVKDAT